ncbi:MAG: WecB/TagA/CpsF family glycosyltransferase [Anaerolineales bacterium]
MQGILDPDNHEPFPTADILGVRVSALTEVDLHCIISGAIDNDEKVLLPNVNAHALNLAFENEWLRDFFNQSTAVFPDGSGALFAGRLQGYPFRERVTYADWLWQLAGFCAANGYSLFLLGGRDSVAELAAKALAAKYPRLVVAGTRAGYFDKRPEGDENKAVIAEINGVSPDILIVGFGMPLQERWLMENWDKLKVHVGLTGGAAFDYISGRLRRPPRFLVDHGLEWLGRLIIEPGRLWRRYLIGIPVFVIRVTRQAIGRLPLRIRH